MRHHDGIFYLVFNTNNLGGAYLYRTDDIENGTSKRAAFGRGWSQLAAFPPTNGGHDH